jgi:hypothetical protein
MPFANSRQVVEGGETALGEVLDPVVVLQAHPGVTSRHHAPGVPEEEGGPDVAVEVATRRPHGMDVGGAGDEHVQEALA